jgi:hypothetical protein
MELPQELIDEIIGHLPKCCPRYLQVCSLVAKSWTHPSQKRLFEDIDMSSRDLRSWLKNISPTDVELLGHIHSLSYLMPQWIGPLHRNLRDYLPSFQQLRYLKLSGTIPLLPQQIEIFSAFQHTLSEISLSYGDVTIKGLIALINYFPNLARLHLSYLRYDKEDGPFPPLSRPLLEGLFISWNSAYDLDLFDELSELGLRANEVVITQTRFTLTWSEVAKRVTSAFGANAKCLRLICPLSTGEIYSNPVIWNLA